MFFRVGAAILIVTIVSLLAITLEKRHLELKRAISLQHDMLQILEEKRARLILSTQTLGAPPRLLEERERQQALRARSSKSASREVRRGN